jgi:DNA repair exonuclease SbcCD ATPase subunit
MSSPPSLPRVSQWGVGEPSAAGNVEESERRRIEIASLRQEVASLLRMNSSLHMRLNQANTREQTSTGGSFGHLDSSAISEPKNPLAWIEERKSLESRAQQLGEECRALESEQAAHELRSNAIVSTHSEPPSLVALLRSRDDMKQRLHATELARSAAEHRMATAEAALARSVDELNARRPRQAAGAQEEARFGPWLVQEVQSLKRELLQEQTKLDDANLALSRKKEQADQSEREHAEARVEYDALVAANEELRKEIATMKEKAEADRRNTKSAKAELSELQAQFRLREFDVNAELQEAKNRSDKAETSLHERRTHLETSEAAAAAARIEGLELQGQLEVLQAAHDKLLAEEQRELAEHEEKASEVRRRAEAVAADRTELEKHLEEVEAATRELQASDAECAKQRDNAARELEAIRSRSAEMARHSQEAILQAEQRIQVLLQQIGDERRQNLELEREISIAREAAGEVGSPPWVVAKEKASGKPKGWASTALQMHRELELLQGWKQEAMDSFRRMQGDMDIAKQHYHNQLQHNKSLQERLEQMGQQAKVAIAGYTSSSGNQNNQAQNADEKVFVLPPPPPSHGVTPLSAGLPLATDSAAAPQLAASMPWLPSAGSTMPAFRPPVPGSSFDAGLLVAGPDLPERPEVPSQVRFPDRWPLPNGSRSLATSSMDLSSASHGIAAAGPVGGPFYDAFRRPERTAPLRVAARAEQLGSRRRRSASSGRTSETVVAPLLSHSGAQASRSLSAGTNGRRR